jgi:ABC-2 type transport system permease protein
VVAQLFRVEILRILSRRAAKALIALVILGVALLLLRFTIYPGFSAAEYARPIIEAAALTIGLLGFLLGASAIGSEWTAGTYAFLLTIEPRRFRVAVAKIGAAVVVVTVAGVSALALATGGAAIVSSLRGTAGANVSNLFELISRATALIAGLTLAGASLAMIGRRMVTALIVALAYLLGGELLVRVGHNTWLPWLLSSNVEALLNGSVLLPGATRRDLIPSSVVIGAGRAGLYLTAILVCVTVVALLTAVYRDVVE